MHDLSQYAFELPDISDWLAGDDRTLAFTVVDADGNAVDIGNATVDWRLFEREYEEDDADAVLKGSDSDVELVTDSRVDTSNGEWEVRIDGAATEDEWGEYYHRPAVEQTDGTRSEWRGTVYLTA
jgi:hypothetical protein